ncbi:MAG TPA: DUF6531 domain-containing protein, partial [Candidatus Cloacimonadota bacterium]|nr:DUF6531 domain-containing protein [Candidatus Cloacimonadota bacterium]
MKLRIWCAVFLLGFFTPGAQAISPADDPWEFCARNHANTRACFDSLKKAEEWIKQEPSIPTGRRFLEAVGDGQISGSLNNPSWVQYQYAVKPRPPKFVAEMYLALVNLYMSFGLGCGCVHPDGVTVQCFEPGWNTRGFETPVLSYGCVSTSGDISPLTQALENYFAAKPFTCEVQIEDEGSYPEGAIYIHTAKSFMGVNYGPWAGRLVYNNYLWSLDEGTQSQLNRIVKLSYGNLRNGQCENVGLKNRMAVSREDRIGCDEGLATYPGKLHPLSAWETTLIGYNEICRSNTTAYIESRQVPSAQCSYGNPCNPGSGEKVWSETDSSGAVPLARSYSSLGTSNADALGPGWSLGYSDRLILPKQASLPSHVLAVDAGGRMERYDRVGTSATYRSRNTPGNLLTHDGVQSWQLDEASGRSLGFQGFVSTSVNSPALGRLLWQQPGKDPSQRLTLEYATATTITDTVLEGVVSDRLAAVTDARGRRLAFTYSYTGHQPNCDTSTPNPACGSLRLVSVELPDGGTIRYDYDADGRLDLV